MLPPSTSTWSTRAVVYPPPGGEQGRVKVFVRCRDPLGKLRQVAHGDASSSTITIRSHDLASSRELQFSQVFPSETEQTEIFMSAGLPLAEKFLDGYHVVAMAYGQTGTGKTYTMQGLLHDNEQWGLIPRLTNHVFKELREKLDGRVTITFSMLEIYKEQLNDLLMGTPGTQLKIREAKTPQEGTTRIWVENLTAKPVTCLSETMRLYSTGLKRRVTAETGINSASSRSHLIASLTLTTASTESVLYMVDLAGSERPGKTGAEGNMMDEGRTINLSLSSLGNVIHALVKAERDHIPYRDSKLTRVLQTAFGGNSLTHVVCTISGDPKFEHETLSTLQFGGRCAGIVNKPILSSRCSAASGSSATESTMISRLQAEILQLKAQLAAKNEMDAATAPVASVSSEHYSLSSVESSLSSGQTKSIQDILFSNDVSDPPESHLPSPTRPVMLPDDGDDDDEEEAPSSSSSSPSGRAIVATAPVPRVVTPPSVPIRENASERSDHERSVGSGDSAASYNGKAVVGGRISEHRLPVEVRGHEREIVETLFEEYKLLLARYAESQLLVCDLRLQLQQSTDLGSIHSATTASSKVPEKKPP